ncbi:6-phosphogluconolactonase [Sedimentitalea sp. JM2-8]|uniref:6-phosphogluconolactonase n=1 Tax=Sedimentitalea xiamensis TaxID=3050037 RepID=A0ABT7FCV1_9RHOB|nr:6-phosphogluconolactonase [Sedimentitalea xiamensis]MDK3072885.1 6-phosphogluconolactonase [Sedimentitalea xiamensis]
MNVVDYPDREMAAIGLANVLAGALNSRLLTSDHASFAVPGGSTPGPVFDALCAADLDWSRVSVFATDERWVPESDPRSNGRLIRSRLLTGPAAEATYLPLYRNVTRPEEVLSEIEESLAPELPISVLLLGMGTDMHTASLFPGAQGLTAALDRDAPAVVAMRPDAVPEARVSLSARVLDEALAKHLVIFGAEKRAALDRALSLPPETAPVQAVLGDMTIHWAE